MLAFLEHLVEDFFHIEASLLCQLSPADWAANDCNILLGCGGNVQSPLGLHVSHLEFYVKL